MDSLTAALQRIVERLQGDSETASLDAQVLLAHVLGVRRAWVLAHPETSLTLEQAVALEAALARLAAGEPLPYVLGHWEFYGLDLRLSPATLIPRPETELLVEQALTWLQAQPGRRWALDVGTGSGCIAIALATHVPDLQVVASDLSLAALKVARENARLHAVGGRVHCLQADLLEGLGRRFDLLCANLPYVPGEALPELRVSRWEPQLALDGGAGGLALIRRLLSGAQGVLSSCGLLLMEIEASQGTTALALARQAFPQAEIQVLADLAGRPRLLHVQLQP